MNAKSSKQEWVGGRFPLPATVLEPELHQPDVIVWVSLPEEVIVAGEVVGPFEDAMSFGDVLLRAMDAPLVGPPRRWSER